ncbi:hypothetical protein BDF21DRAFT_455997 [Thamnidium elegans]|uniref:Uncharacterized protein n=1 Tax=Thamnidium elegans TaxID=101142 RepID=A0A8H7ST78_9FUNG|nr:hypothetical protein INT48_005823 [Thamnidium elegans]KAI8058856.1 hypothetical protein BDF21DRAFT_455997 [Thamnidium elegans]
MILTTTLSKIGRPVTESKYYHDKRNPILNGIIQLDNILRTYSGSSKDVKLPLFQVLGFQGHIHYMYRLDSQYYVIEKVCTLEYPYNKRDTLIKATNFVVKLLVLKNLAADMEEHIHQASENKKKKH